MATEVKYDHTGEVPQDSFYAFIYWSDQAAKATRAWIEAGKPETGAIYDKMDQTQLEFDNAYARHEFETSLYGHMWRCLDGLYSYLSSLFTLPDFDRKLKMC